MEDVKSATAVDTGDSVHRRSCCPRVLQQCCASCAGTSSQNAIPSTTAYITVLLSGGLVLLAQILLDHIER